jgi:hypothetical protein
MPPILTGLRGYFILAREMREGTLSCRDFQTLFGKIPPTFGFLKPDSLIMVT